MSLAISIVGAALLASVSAADQISTYANPIVPQPIKLVHRYAFDCGDVENTIDPYSQTYSDVYTAPPYRLTMLENLNYTFTLDVSCDDSSMFVHNVPNKEGRTVNMPISGATVMRDLGEDLISQGEHFAYEMWVSTQENNCEATGYPTLFTVSQDHISSGPTHAIAVVRNPKSKKVSLMYSSPEKAPEFFDSRYDFDGMQNVQIVVTGQAYGVLKLYYNGVLCATSGRKVYGVHNGKKTVMHNGNYPQYGGSNKWLNPKYMSKYDTNDYNETKCKNEMGPAMYGEMFDLRFWSGIFNYAAVAKSFKKGNNNIFAYF